MSHKTREDLTGQYTGGDQTQALAEGWGLFDVDSTGYLEIQKLDESDAFDDDDSAIAFVTARADEGSEYHQLAIQAHLWHAENNERPSTI